MESMGLFIAAKAPRSRLLPAIVRPSSSFRTSFLESRLCTCCFYTQPNFKQANCSSFNHVWLFATPRMVASVHRILQARILEWVAIPFSRGSFQPRGQTQVSHTAGRFFTDWAKRQVYDKEASLDPSHFCVHFAAGRYQIFVGVKTLGTKITIIL